MSRQYFYYDRYTLKFLAWIGPEKNVTRKFKFVKIEVESKMNKIKKEKDERAQFSVLWYNIYKSFICLLNLLGLACIVHMNIVNQICL